MKQMKQIKRIVTLLFVISVLFGCASTSKKMPSGSIHFEEVQLMAILAGDWGQGSVGFNGKTYTFKVNGLGVGGMGIKKLSATGNVYDLNNIADLEGIYFEARAGITAIKGKGGLWLKNGKGVVMHITTHSEGVALSVGVEGLKIELN